MVGLFYWNIYHVLLIKNDRKLTSKRILVQKRDLEK